ncbi:MAG TPA: AAA family ATPase [Acidiferrobacterales bacterium]|nr:AAA family ATPase [Acidiferrobacterales bacterium]
MLERIIVKNFRSIEECDVELAPITVLFGPTAAGKSTLLYSALALRNFVLNPNQAVDGLFNLGFQNLGGYDACIYNHDSSKHMSLEVRYNKENASGVYGINLSKNGATISLKTKELKMTCQVSLPYALNQTSTLEYGETDASYNITWNGITSSVVAASPTASTQARAQEIATSLNLSVEAIRRIDVAPHKRGFFKPSYTVVPLSPTPTTEDEVASLIMNDMHLPPRISALTEEIFGRDFRLYVPPGTAMAYLQTTEKRARVPVYLVNDGFGVNQIIYILAKINRVDVDTVLIEEPEVHLHPSIIRKFARALSVLVKDEHKQVILTTHSEQFLVSILTCIKEGTISPADVRCYHVMRDKKNTTFEQQRVDENGQIEGGLSSFIEAEIEDLKVFLSKKS